MPEERRSTVSENSVIRLFGYSVISRGGFTIIELLVASLLLGMLVTILTMVFNQSSTAWRIGVAGVADMDDIRDNIAELREEADNAILYGNQIYRLTGLWKKDGTLRDRACDAPGSEVVNEDGGKHRALLLRAKASYTQLEKGKNAPVNVGQTGKASGSAKTYTVNVKSAGPDREFDTWDDIWSWPDDFE